MEDCKRELAPKTRPLTYITGAAIAFAVVLTAACGSNEAGSTNNSNGRVRTGNSLIQKNSNSANIGSQQAETAGANVQDPANRKLQRLEQLKARAANSAGQPSLPVTARPAAENSEITVELRDAARETRTFKSHPTISKLEKVSNGKKVAVIVTFNDGRRVELPGDSVKNVETITTIELLRLVENGGNRSARASRQQQLKKENR